MPKRKFALTAVLDKCLFPLLSAFHQRVARIGLWLLFSQFCLVAWAFINSILGVLAKESLLFCWTFIPMLIGLIEGIVYLTMTDDKFNAKYG
jgi:TM2 domain-containing membrane protein YozV